MHSNLIRSCGKRADRWFRFWFDKKKGFHVINGPHIRSGCSVPDASNHVRFQSIFFRREKKKEQKRSVMVAVKPGHFLIPLSRCQNVGMCTLSLISSTMFVPEERDERERIITEEKIERERERERPLSRVDTADVRRGPIYASSILHYG